MDTDRLYQLLFSGPLLLIWLLPVSPLWAGPSYPLEPVDTSSPRATLNSFRTNVDDIWEFLGGEYWESPNYKLLSQAMAE